MPRRKKRMDMEESFKGSFKSFVMPTLIATLLVVLALIFLINNII